MVANTVASRKAKGRLLQNHVAEVLGRRFPYLTVGKDKDIQGREMGQSGTDVRLSAEAKRYIIFDVECKAVESLNIWSALAQAESNTEKGRVPLVVFKRNRSKVYACLELDKLLWLME